MPVTGSSFDSLAGEPAEVGEAAQPGPLPSGDLSGEVLGTAHAQARQRAEMGDLTGARTLLEEALATGELQYGRDHPQLAPLMVDLATIARNVGNLTEAQNQLRRAYGIVVSAAGPEHATSLSIEGRLAAVNYRLGEPTEAYDWHIADVGARVLGPDHPAVRGAQQRLAATPVHEERTPPVEPPQPTSYASFGGSYEGGSYEGGPYEADEGGWAPGYASYAASPAVSSTPGYLLSPTEPGVYHRQPTPGQIEVPRLERADPQDWSDGLIDAPRTRGHAGGVALVAIFGLAIIAAALVIAYQVFGSGTPGQSAAAQPTSPTTRPAPTATATPTTPTTPVSATPYGGNGLPPGQVVMKDDGYSVTLSWLDPSAGSVPFLVTGGRVGEPPTPVASVAPGHTTQTLYGLNPKYDYCYTVAAVWSTDLVQPSPQVCTKRASTAAGT
jgi:hypothetical protein